MGLYDEIYCEVELPDRDAPLTPGSRPNLFRGQGLSVIGLPRRGVLLMRAVEISSRRDILIFSDTTTTPPMDWSSIELVSTMAH